MKKHTVSLTPEQSDYVKSKIRITGQTMSEYIRHIITNEMMGSPVFLPSLELIGEKLKTDEPGIVPGTIHCAGADISTDET